jgi:hypothetical protein
MHALIAVCLAGEKMAAAFDAKPAWRERWKLDEQGVVRVRKSVTRAATSLPMLIMFALAPREGAGYALAAGALTLALLGLGGLLAQRTWGVMALGGAAATTALLVGLGGPVNVHHLYGMLGFAPMVAMPLVVGVVTTVLLAAAALPFARPMAAYLRHRR